MSVQATDIETVIDHLDVSVYSIPTDQPESDGTLRWDATTIVVVQIRAGGVTGLGYSYADASAVHLIHDTLASIVVGRDAMAVSGIWTTMVRKVRNIGRPGLASMAIAAIDVALWDLKARLLDLPLVTLLGQTRDAAPIYGSGGFTSYSLEQLQEQLNGWVSAGIPRVKMKIGRHPEDDVMRVRAAREAIGPAAELFVDANGAYSRKQALAQAELFAEDGVTWFEEPVSSDDLDGLRLLRDLAPAGMEITAGEYGYDLPYFRQMLDANAVDVLQADATRCAGITEFLRAAVLCEVRSLEISAHTAPGLHLHPCCAIPNLRHIEYFHDHVRIEHMLFDGVPEPRNGTLGPDLSRAGHGLEFRQVDAEPYKV
jgi:L-alanine-DL-glutamate epimerase-like enolase superfamily enzyme